MRLSRALYHSFNLSLLLCLSACGGGGGGGGTPAPSSATASQVATSISAAVSSAGASSSLTPSSSTTLSSSLATTSSSQPASSVSSSVPLSSSSPSSSSRPASSVGSLSSCRVDGTVWSVCGSDNSNWGYENNQYCISQSFCPDNRTSAPTLATRTAPISATTERSKRVYDYLRSIWGKQVLTGQMDLTWKDAIDMYQRVLNDTGKAPALMGYDFMNYGMTANWVEGIEQTEEAIEHHERGGLVTFSWHWRDPSRLKTANVNDAQFYTNDTAFVIPVANGALNTNSPAYGQINAGIDLIAVELKKLQTADVPVLWRPLHEAAGYQGNGWFWWGRSRTDGVPQAYAQILLWRHMYDRLVNYHKLDNLIWVWNGQSPAWYPGDDVVDIMSFDIYDSSDNKTYKSQIETYTALGQYSGEKKMLALTENGYIPNPDNMKKDNAWWLWFMTWNDGNFDGDLVSGTHKDNFWSGEHYNTAAHKTHVYNHELVITLDKLPSFDGEQ